jgi:endoglucanase
LTKYKTSITREDAWGGYMDAGDWDRRISHLNATRQLLELFLMYPVHYEQKELPVLPGEKNNGIPDILDEVAWNVDCYGRMQGLDGGISMGIESAEHPVDGEPSWMESLDILRFAEDPKSSLHYAGVAAQLSRAMAPYNKERANWYAESAKKAFSYGQKFKQFPKVKDLPAHRQQAIKDEAALAAIELYKLTREADYYKVFEEYASHGQSIDNQQSPSFVVLDAAFSLATAEIDAQVTEVARERAVGFIIEHADKMVSMVHGNVYGITNRIPGAVMVNGYYSGVNNQEICRAYFLSGEKKYLEAAVLSIMYTSGANPMNMSPTTGLGHRYPRRPLHLDSEFTGQRAPDGITVYAQADHEYYRSVLEEKELGGAWGTWATYWYSGKVNVPSGWDWPPHEAYIDYSRFPGMNEYTVHQTFGPASYAYGFLDAR